MDFFGIIGALESYAATKGYAFLYKFDEFYTNIEIQKQYEAGEIVMTVDSKATPTIQNGKVTSVNYSVLMSLGRKFDVDGTVASLDESSRQKYDRRLKDLETLLANSIAEFSCDNELDVAPGEIFFSINDYDTNIDFAVTNVTFTQ